MTTLVAAMGATAQENGTELFDESYVHEIRITFQESSFWTTLSNDYDNATQNGTDVPYRQADMTIDGVSVSAIGVRQKGYFSNWGAMGSVKKPLKISTDEFTVDQEYDGVRRINLSNGFMDPSMMRDVLAYKFMRSAGIPAPRTAYAKVYLNNTYWGLYIMVEEVDKRSLKNWYGGQNNDGNLFKCINNTSLNWQGTSVSQYTDEFELKTNEDVNDWSRFLDFVEAISASNNNFETEITPVLDIDKYVKVLAADVLMLNWDSYYYHGRNFFLYVNPQTNKIDWIPWDYNLAFSTSETDVIIDYSMSDVKPLVKKLQLDTDLRGRYFNAMCELNEDFFTLANLESFITTTGALIRPALLEDQNKFYSSINDFDQSLIQDVTVDDPMSGQTTVRGLKQFITERNTAVGNQLVAHGHDCSTLGTDTEELTNVSLYPNPFQEQFRIQAREVMERVEILTSQGQLLQTIYPDALESTVSLAHYAAGMYLVRVSTAGASTTITVVKE